MTATVFPAPEQGQAVHTVDAQGLSKQFGNEVAVQDLSFYVPSGKIVGFIGPSGCGKTTTVRLLTGIYRPTAGQAIVLGREPQHFDARTRSRMGYMPQHFVLYPDLSVLENMNFAASLYGLGLLKRRKPVMDLLDFVELVDDRYKLARNISGGMQRRLALAATLVHNPELIFLDEPTAGIDPILRRKFWDHFNELQNEGRTLFVTTQYVNEAAYCNLVGVMASGRLLMLDTPENLRRHAFGGEVIDIRAAQPLGWNLIDKIQSMPFVKKRASVEGDSVRLVVDEASTAIPELLSWLNQQNVKVNSIEEYLPPFDDVFVMIVEDANRQLEAANGQMVAGEKRNG